MVKTVWKMVVETVVHEPVSGLFSLFNRENTGKKCDFGGFFMD